MGDVEDQVSDKIAAGLVSNNGLMIKYIKIPHHGSNNGLTYALIDEVKPQIAVISVGKNLYGHSLKKVLDLSGEEKG